jgi:hypothetical protein
VIRQGGGRLLLCATDESQVFSGLHPSNLGWFRRASATTS